MPHTGERAAGGMSQKWGFEGNLLNVELSKVTILHWIKVITN